MSHGSGVTIVASQVDSRRRGCSKVIVNVSVKVFTPFDPVIAILAFLACVNFD